MRCAIRTLLAASAVSGAAFLGMDVEVSDGDLVTMLTVDGYTARRYPVPFDPDLMEVRLIDAWVGAPDGGRIELPAWAVDTLSEVSGMPLAIVVAFPGLPGRGGFLRVEIRDSSGMWDDGPWFDFTVPDWADSVRLVFHGLDGEPSWDGDGYSFSMTGDEAVFEGDSSSGRLTVSGFESWESLYGYLSESFDARSADSLPLSIREAGLEAAAAGADEAIVVARLRTLICNSFTLQFPGHPSRFLDVDSLDELMRSRSADRLELALVASSVLGALDIETDLLFGSSDPAPVPVPTDWDRPLLSVRLSDGRSILVDPSAFLNSAFHIPGRESLMLLGPGRDRLLEPPAGGPEDFWRETWDIAPDGAFSLSVSTGGAADSLLRHRLAGLDGPAAAAALALWIFQGGEVVSIGSMETSDLFDLSSGASIEAAGSLASAMGPGAPVRLPILRGGPGQGFMRAWNLPLRISAATDGLRVSNGGFTLEDTLGLESAPVAWTEY